MSRPRCGPHAHATSCGRSNADGGMFPLVPLAGDETQGDAASRRWVKAWGQEGTESVVCLERSTAACETLLLVCPYHSHTYIRSSSWYVCMVTGAQTSCVHYNPSGNMLCVNILIHLLSWSGGLGFFWQPCCPFLGGDELP